MSASVRYFAYGSNMDKERMKERVGAYEERVHATLEGHALCFNKLSTKYNNTGVANVLADQHSKTEGILYTLSEDALNTLDDWEVCPKHYARVELMVTLDSAQRVSAWVYIAQPEKVREGLKPSTEYMQHLLAGSDLLSAEYVTMLKEWILA